MKHIAVAIDGPSGAGKSTIAKEAAGRLGFLYIDTGALYRAIGLAVYRQGVDPKDGEEVSRALAHMQIALGHQEGSQRVFLNGEDVSEAIRTHEISQYASLVSAIPAVRDYLLALQRDIAQKNDIVMDGRDIGTVILPAAQVKIFLTASVETRAARRHKELEDKGQSIDYAQVLADMIRRDAQDSERAIAPLKQASDAVLVDTSALTLEESIGQVLAIIEQTMRN